MDVARFDGRHRVLSQSHPDSLTQVRRCWQTQEGNETKYVKLPPNDGGSASRSDPTDSPPTDSGRCTNTRAHLDLALPVKTNVGFWSLLRMSPKHPPSPPGPATDGNGSTIAGIPARRCCSAKNRDKLSTQTKMEKQTAEEERGCRRRAPCATYRPPAQRPRGPSCSVRGPGHETCVTTQPLTAGTVTRSPAAGGAEQGGGAAGARPS